MAEERKKFNKKWLILIAVLVLIAVIVVTIILCLPGNPKSTLQALKNEEKSFLLKDANARLLYTNYENKVNNSDVKAYSKEMSDVEIVLDSLSKVVDKYEDYAVFFELNDYFYNNYKPATNALNDLQKQKDAFISQLEIVEKDYTEDSADFLRQSWINTRNIFVKILENLKITSDTLNNIFENSYFGLEQNLATRTSLNAINDYISVLTTSFSALAEADKEENTITQYSYDSDGITKAFENFVNGFFSGQIATDSKNFYLEDNISSKYQEINNFYSVFSQNSFQTLIASAKISANDIIFTLLFEEVEDDKGCLELVKTFLGGYNG